MGFSLSPERGHEVRTREVPQEDRCSSMYTNCYAFLSCTHMYELLARLFGIRLSVFAIPVRRESNS